MCFSDDVSKGCSWRIRAVIQPVIVIVWYRSRSSQPGSVPSARPGSTLSIERVSARVWSPRPAGGSSPADRKWSNQVQRRPPLPTTGRRTQTRPRSLAGVLKRHQRVHCSQHCRCSAKGCSGHHASAVQSTENWTRPCRATPAVGPVRHGPGQGL